MLRELTVGRPADDFVVLVDGALHSLDGWSLPGVTERLVLGIEELLTSEPDVVVLANVWPAATLEAIESKGIDAIITPGPEQLRHLEENWRSGTRVGVFGEPLVTDCSPYNTSTLVGGIWRPIDSSRASPVFERKIARDHLTVEVVRDVAREILLRDVEVLVAADLRLHLVEDLARRSLGRDVRIVPSPQLVADRVVSTFGAGVATKDPQVRLKVASDDIDRVTALAREFLQMATPSGQTAGIGAPERRMTEVDRVLLAYSAFGLRAGASLVEMLGDEFEIVLGDGRTLLLPELLAKDCARAPQCFVVDELMWTDANVGVTGRITKDSEPNAEGLPFAHIWYFDGEDPRRLVVM